jgi:signal transduction histidine kinase
MIPPAPLEKPLSASFGLPPAEPLDTPISGRTETTMLLRVYQLSVALCLLVLLVLVPFFIVRKTVPALGATIGLVAALVGIAMLRRGHAKRSMWLMVFAVWSASSLMTFSGLPHVMMPLVLATSVVVAIVIGSRAAGAFGGSFLLFWLLVRVATDLGWTAPILYERHWITWVMAGTSFVMIMLPILALLDEQRLALSKLSREIGERRRAEQAMRGAAHMAEAASRAKSEFLANMSHEIRTPMNGILGMLQLTMLTELTGAQRSKLGHAEDAARSLLRIIDDILDLSKIEAGRLELETVDFSLDETMGRLATLVRPSAKDKGLHFDIALDDDVPRWLIGDPLRLGQVLLNLCSNAVKFTERGSVQVRVTRRGGGTAHVEAGNQPAGAAPAGMKPAAVELEFSVRDTGIGISEGDRGWLFQSFSQADSSTTRRFGGTGLGLTISKRLTERMGGRIEVESAVGHGSLFRFNAHFGLADPATAAPARRAQGRRRIGHRRCARAARRRQSDQPGGRARDADGGGCARRGGRRRRSGDRSAGKCRVRRRADGCADARHGRSGGDAPAARRSAPCPSADHCDDGQCPGRRPRSLPGCRHDRLHHQTDQHADDGPGHVPAPHGPPALNGWRREHILPTRPRPR